MSAKTITINPDGSIEFIWADELAPLLEAGEATIKRASHVEPNECGQWVADMSPVGGPVLEPCALRAEALKLEEAWLLANRL